MKVRFNDILVGIKERDVIRIRRELLKLAQESPLSEAQVWFDSVGPYYFDSGDIEVTPDYVIITNSKWKCCYW